MVRAVQKVYGYYGSTLCTRNLKPSSYHNTLSYLTETQHRISDQHEELGQSRKLSDFNDLQKLNTWF